MTAETTQSELPTYPMRRLHARRVNPVTIGTGVQVTIVICLTLIAFAVIGAIGGA